MPESAPRCKTTLLTHENIETGLFSVLHGVLTDMPIKDVISHDHLVAILHRATEILQKEPMLLEVQFTNGVIVGDLHGSFVDLLSVIHEAGVPPRKKYLFLGDYVDRGKHQIETFLFILLMKLRWPDSVHMLRGNHELYDTNASNEFINVCNAAYDDPSVYPLFSRLFDVLPVAAILNDEALCCHGGISQWMTSRDAIRNITRPTYLARMKLLENCLLCDILWADYASETERPFAPSIRGSSYAFNKTAIETVLEALKCKRLIRAHQPFRGGAVENCKNLCYTVHTVPVFRREFHGAYLWVKESINGRIDYKLRSHNLIFPKKTYTMENFAQSVKRILLASFQLDLNGVYDDPGFHKSCSLCAVKMPVLNKKARLISHTELIEWVHENARDIVEKHRMFDEFDTGIGYDPRRIALCFVALFPLAFDILNTEGRTYRLAVRPDEWDFIQKWHPNAVATRTALSLEESDVVFELEPRSITVDQESEHGLKVARAIQKFEDVENSSETLPMLTRVEIKDVKKNKAVIAKIKHFFRRRRRSSHKALRKKT